MTTIIIDCIIIMSLRIVDVSLATTRTILLTKGKAKTAAVLGFFEILIYTKVLTDIVTNLGQWYYLIAYALGFSFGNYIGTKIERRLAFGDVQIRMIVNPNYYHIIDELRQSKFGVTTFAGEGRDGERKMILITAKRKRVNELYGFLKKNNIDAFVSVNDITSYSGGYMISSNKKK
ncbi:DUF2179 domain-containing protein [Proteocatella sphenisci]|uniref:DUF2179 domain-containing protein n=1 Tax=Proteocatella sphenisci TaxID=181070 RepID=UPI00048B4BB0|nr:DUF5698 domain-containing protein [Proteocatella sphenisci]